jgi:hypothetical protein
MGVRKHESYQVRLCRPSSQAWDFVDLFGVLRQRSSVSVSVSLESFIETAL